MELYLPPTYAKLTRGCEFYETTEKFKRHSAASKAKATKYWSDERHRQRIDKKQAKPVDVFDLEGNFVGTYPSARKCAIAMFPDIDYHKAERCIRSIRKGGNGKKSYRGYMFRDALEVKSGIEPYRKAPKRKGYTVNRKAGTFSTVPVSDTYLGITRTFGSIKECAEAIGCSMAAMFASLKRGTPVMGHDVRRIGERRLQR